MNIPGHILHFMKPSVPQKYLLFVAAIVWNVAGIALIVRGLQFMIGYPQTLWLNLILSLVGGAIFYWVMFSKISTKHINRISNIANNRPCLFSFFDWKGYMMMVPMMSLGVWLRTSGVVSPFYLSFGYIIMGTPLLFSSFRFYFYGYKYLKF